MRTFDTNGDGKVPHAEFKKSAQQHFKKIDADSNGKLTWDEFKNFKKQQRFSRMDSNQDNKISKEEFISHKTKKMERKFSHLDKNNDGVITKDEMVRKKHKTCPYHKDKDHKNFHETHHKKMHGSHHGRGLKRAHYKFKRMDENEDGVITKKESLKAWDNKFKKIDSNKDKVVTQQEVSTYKKQRREKWCKKK